METDVSLADISSLPLSVYFAGDMLQPDHQLKLGDYKSAIGEMMLESVNSTGAPEPDIKVETEALEDCVKEKRQDLVLIQAS